MPVAPNNNNRSLMPFATCYESGIPGTTMCGCLISLAPSIHFIHWRRSRESGSIFNQPTTCSLSLIRRCPSLWCFDCCPVSLAVRSVPPSLPCACYHVTVSLATTTPNYNARPRRGEDFRFGCLSSANICQQFLREFPLPSLHPHIYKRMM